MPVGTLDGARHPAVNASGTPVSGRLTPCADCGRQVSIHALSCPSCGRPFGPPPRAREGPFLQTLNVGCLAAFWSFVAMAAGGFFLAAVEVVRILLRHGWHGLVR